jgi:hypothetical protein
MFRHVCTVFPYPVQVGWILDVLSTVSSAIFGWGGVVVHQN